MARRAQASVHQEGSFYERSLELLRQVCSRLSEGEAEVLLEWAVFERRMGAGMVRIRA